MITFEATGGNVATVTEKQRGDLIGVDVCWHHTPSPEDMKECDEWYSNRNPETAVLPSVRVESPNQAKRIIDAFIGTHEDN